MRWSRAIRAIYAALLCWCVDSLLFSVVPANAAHCCAAQLHNSLFRRGLLPMPHAHAPNKDGDQCILRLAQVRFIKMLGVSVRPGARCLSWDDPHYIHHVKACQPANATFSFSFEPDPLDEPRPARIDTTRRRVLGDLRSLVLPSRVPPNARFDLLLVNDVFEHVSRPFDAAAALFNLVTPGGRVIWTAPFIERFHCVPEDYFRWDSGSYSCSLIARVLAAFHVRVAVERVGQTCLTCFCFPGARYTCDGATELFERAGFVVEERRKIGNDKLTSGFVLGFKPSDFDAADLDDEHLISAPVPSDQNTMYLACMISARRPR